MTVLITGGTGFLGGYLAGELPHAITVGRKNYDLRDRDQIWQMFDDHRQVQAVIHLAATVGGIGANQKEPGRFLYENALMGLELLEACRAHHVKKVVVAGTVCAYPKHTPVPFRETDLWDGYPEETNAPYALAKRLLLVQGQAYRAQYGLNVVHLLPANLYGPHDNFDPNTSHVIPAMIRRLVDARDQDQPSVTFWGSGGASREFLHAADAARAFRLALERYDQPEPLNIGSGREVSIDALAHMLAAGIGYRGRIEWDHSRPDGQPRRCLDTSRAEKALSFRAAIPLDVGLVETIRWYEQARVPAAS